MRKGGTESTGSFQKFVDPLSAFKIHYHSLVWLEYNCKSSHSSALQELLVFLLKAFIYEIAELCFSTLLCYQIPCVVKYRSVSPGLCFQLLHWGGGVWPPNPSVLFGLFPSPSWEACLSQLVQSGTSRNCGNARVKCHLPCFSLPLLACMDGLAWFMRVLTLTKIAAVCLYQGKEILPADHYLCSGTKLKLLK